MFTQKAAVAAVAAAPAAPAVELELKVHYAASGAELVSLKWSGCSDPSLTGIPGVFSVSIV